ncbi:hypothetical protein NXY25_04735 [Bacteroides thetaiotaomicron]|nr:hypothetical protein [Bacteroides thetaiotaomicron]MCS3266663.1 hypothetical protein [Bacteroides fragilis]
MSITNIISNDEVTLVQGVDGLFFAKSHGLRKAGRLPGRKRRFPKKSLK